MTLSRKTLTVSACYSDANKDIDKGNLKICII